MSQDLIKQAQIDLDALRKLAGKQTTLQATGQYAKSLLGPLLLTLAGAGAAGAVSYYSSKKDRDEHQAALGDSFSATLRRHPSFMKDIPTYTQRFGELTAISPTIAKNPNLASKVIQQKFGKGFSIDDIHRLSSIESNTRGGQIQPDAAGRAAANHAFGMMMQTFGPMYFNHANKSMADFKTEIKKAREGKKQEIVDKLVPTPEATTAEQKDQILKGLRPRLDAHKKEGAAGNNHDIFEHLNVSEECLGTMLSERAVLLKTAGFMQAAGKSFGKGNENLFKNVLPYMLPSLAIAGGVKLIDYVMDHRRNTKADELAEAAFSQLKRTSSVVKGNQEEARQAFDTLKMFAPTLATRPMVMRTFVENTVNAGQLPPDQISLLAAAENTVRGLPPSLGMRFAPHSEKEGLLHGLKSTSDMFTGKLPDTSPFKRSGSSYKKSKKGSGRI